MRRAIRQNMSRCSCSIVARASNAPRFFRRSRVGRYVHSWNPDGTVAATMQEKPRDLFERVFGSLAVDDRDPDVQGRQDVSERRPPRVV